jgi:hypothetical protein
MLFDNQLISARRDDVLQSYKSAEAHNRRLFLEGSNKATSEYVYPNQKEDANNIVDMLTNEDIYVVSVQKKTKVGADGLMIEAAKLMTTHIDDNKIVNPENVRIITGMSNIGWEKDMIDKSPSCFKKNIFHHGKLSKSHLIGLKNSLIIIDEIDSGDKDSQVLHITLKEAGLLDVKHMKENNNKFIFISATMFKELYDLYQWGELHSLYKMTIPPSYIGHEDFLKKKIIQEFYPLTTIENITKWITEDIIDNYNDDYRVHIVRVNNKNVNMIHNECIRKNIDFKNHTSNDRLTDKDIKEIFEDPLSKHIVIAIKGLFRRANLIPDRYKLRIGATHELHTKKVDNNVQNQGLPGRLTGYWRSTIESGHKTGPYRTSIKAIEEYEKIYNDPFGYNSYESDGFHKKKGKVTISKSTMLSPKHILNLTPVNIPITRNPCSEPIVIIEAITDEEKRYFKQSDVMVNIIKKYKIEVYEKYKSYEVHCWNINTENKCEKYGLKSMTMQDAYSSETNIRDKNINMLMIYLHENQLIISPWSGENNKDEKKAKK